MNKPFALKYFGHHDRPGRSEFRTSCRHALAALRRSIEIYMRLWINPGISLSYCPPLMSNYPKKYNQKKRDYSKWLIYIWKGEPPSNKE